MNLLLIDQDSAYLRSIGLTLQAAIDARIPEVKASLNRSSANVSRRNAKRWSVWTAHSWHDVLAFTHPPELVLCRNPPEPTVTTVPDVDDSSVTSEPIVGHDEVYGNHFFAGLRRLSQLFPDAAVAAMVPTTAVNSYEVRLSIAHSGGSRILDADEDVSRWVEPLFELAALGQHRLKVNSGRVSFRRSDAAESSVAEMMGETSQITAQMYSLGTLVDRVGEQFEVWVDCYVSIVHASRQQRVVQEKIDIAERLAGLAVVLRRYDASGRDVMALHRAATSRISETVDSRRQRSGLLQESRLILVGLLGKLVNLYRTTRSD